MSKFYVLLCVLGALSQPVFAGDSPVVDIQTNHGTITVQLAPDKSPLTVANFLTYVGEGFYENTLFHRVIAGFMVQGGGFTPDMHQKQTHTPIKLESNNSVSNLRGTIAMARTSIANSATSQFFINTVDNGFLNYQNANNMGYAVFGQVIEGMSVVDNISSEATSKATATKDVPLQPVIITAAHVREAQVAFKELKSLYKAGESLTIALQESVINRQRVLDLWVAVKLPSGALQFISPENTALFSPQAKPFKRNVSVSDTQHAVLTLNVPSGLAGQYTLLAIFNEPGSDVSEVMRTVRSNIASASVELR